MLLNIAARKGNLLSFSVTNANELIQHLDIIMRPKELKALRDTALSETDVVEKILEKRYPNNPVSVYYDEDATCMRITVYETLKAPKVLMTIDGGVVQWTMATGPVEVLRLETEDGVDEKRAIEWTDIDGKTTKVEAHMEYPNAKEREFVERVYAQVTPQIAALKKM
jgi:hypothetical protein